MAVVALLMNSESVEGAKLKQRNGYYLEDTSLLQESESMQRNHNYYKKARAEEMLAQQNAFVNDIYEPDVQAAQAFDEVDNMVGDFQSQNNDQSMLETEADEMNEKKHHHSHKQTVVESENQKKLEKIETADEKKEKAQKMLTKAMFAQSNVKLMNHQKKHFTHFESLSERKHEKKRALKEEAEAAKDESRAQIALS